MKRNTKKLFSYILIACLITILGLYASSSDVKVSNAASSTKKSSLTIKFSKNSGAYTDEINLSITCKGASKIYYTTDGSNPISSSTKKLYKTTISVADRSKDKNIVSAVDPNLFDAAYVKLSWDRKSFESTVSAPSNGAVDKCTVIKAVAVDSKGIYTGVVTNTYFIGNIAKHIQGIEESCKASGTSLAVISLSMNYEDLFDSKKGIYVKGDVYNNALKQLLTTKSWLKVEDSRGLEANYTQKGKKWERNVHMDYFESNGSSTSIKLQQDCGISIQGNFSRSDLVKSFRLTADTDYGKKSFDYEFFGNELKNDSGKTMNKFKTLTLRNGGNCTYTTKYSDTYWQSLVKKLNCDTQTSRPCVVYINGEYWGLYVLQEDYTDNYFEDTHGVNKDDVVEYKGIGSESDLDLGYKLDIGELPKGVKNETYYYNDLLKFFKTHKDLKSAVDYEAFSKLVDVKSARDYFAVNVWVNNKWDWPGKNWLMWKTTKVDASNPYADGKWRFCFIDLDFGGVMGTNDAYANPIKDDGYLPKGLLDMTSKNPFALTFAYLMTNAEFRSDFAKALNELSNKTFEKTTALKALDLYKDTYAPLYDQFFTRYPATGDKNSSINSGYASYRCIKDFLSIRANNIKPILDYVDNFFK